MLFCHSVELNNFLIYFQLQKKIEEPIHILNIAVKVECQRPDDYYAQLFGDFCAEQVDIFFKYSATSLLRPVYWMVTFF